MPSTNVLPASDILATHWGPSSGGDAGWQVLSANSGTGNGSLTWSNNGSGGAYEAGTTFSTTGIASITAASFTMHWADLSKSATADFSIQLYNTGLTTSLTNSIDTQTTSTSEITTNTSFTITDSTVADWSNFSIKILDNQHAGDGAGDSLLYGLYITVTYTTSATTGPPSPMNLYLGRIAGPEKIYAGPNKTITAYGFR
jgi:hypothetical protein